MVIEIVESGGDNHTKEEVSEVAENVVGLRGVGAILELDEEKDEMEQQQQDNLDQNHLVQANQDEGVQHLLGLKDKGGIHADRVV